MQDARPKVLTTTPLFVVADLQRSIDFYCQKLGFREPAVWGNPPCFAMLNRDGFDLMLNLAEGPDKVRPNGPDRVWDLFVAIEDLPAEITALKAAGVELEDRSAARTEYGMIEIEVCDPDGHRICFGQNVP